MLCLIIYVIFRLLTLEGYFRDTSDPYPTCHVTHSILYHFEKSSTNFLSNFFYTFCIHFSFSSIICSSTQSYFNIINSYSSEIRNFTNLIKEFKLKSLCHTFLNNLVISMYLRTLVRTLYNERLNNYIVQPYKYLTYMKNLYHLISFKE